MQVNLASIHFTEKQISVQAKKIMEFKSSTKHIVVCGILGERCHHGLLYKF